MERVWAAVAIILFLVSVTASAQTPTDDVRARVKQGQKVSVTDDQGREFKGRIADLASDVLTIARGRQRDDVPYADIVKIDRLDGLKNGALIGLVAGAALGLAAVEDSSDCDSAAFFCGDPDAGNYLAVSLIMGGLGAAIGTGIDALIGGDRTIYQRGGGTRINLAPAVGRQKVGAVVAIAW